MLTPASAPRTQPRFRKSLIGLFLPWLLGLALLAWAFQGIRLGEIWHILGHLRAGQWIMLLLLNGAIFLLISGRWWLILRAQGYAMPLTVVAAYRLVSFGISYFTPGPQLGGEPAQVYFLQNRHGIPLATAVTSVSLDKIVELLANFVFVMLGLLLALQAGWSAPLSALPRLGWMAVPFALLLAYVLGLWRGATPLSWLLRRMPSHSTLFERLGRLVNSAEGQIGHFCRQKPGTMALAWLVSALIWLAMVLEYALAARFLGIRLSLPQAIAIQTAAMVAFLFPLPAGLGALEASQVLAVTALGFEPAIGLSLSLLMRGRDVALGGLGILWAGILSTRFGRRRLPTYTNE